MNVVLTLDSPGQVRTNLDVITGRVILQLPSVASISVSIMTSNSLTNRKVFNDRRESLSSFLVIVLPD